MAFAGVRNRHTDGALSVPLRYMHTSVETLDMADMQCAKELLARFAAELGEDMEEWLCI